MVVAMRCLICATVASEPRLASAPLDDVPLRYIAGSLLDSVHRVNLPAMGGTMRHSTPDRPLITERCARVLEEACGACGRIHTCRGCAAAALLRERSDEIYAAHDKAVASETIDQYIDHVIGAVCEPHQRFAAILHEEHQKRQAWSLALSIEKGGAP